MKKRTIIIATAIAAAFLLGGCDTSWLVGHDNGEAYEKYMESMKEHGLAPDAYGYGYGW